MSDARLGGDIRRDGGAIPNRTASSRWGIGASRSLLYLYVTRDGTPTDAGRDVAGGEESMRFEVRAGDCAWSYYSWQRTPKWNDCKYDRERRERKQDPHIEGGEKWYHFSLFLPEDFTVIDPVQTVLGQFHEGLGRKGSFMFYLDRAGYRVRHGARHTKYSSVHGGGTIVGNPYILKVSEMRGKWTDILMHVKWSSVGNGFFRVYVNGNAEPSYAWSVHTKRNLPTTKVHWKFGIYRVYVSRYYAYRLTKKIGYVPTQVAYYDDVRKGSSCKEVTEYFDCGAIDGK